MFIDILIIAAVAAILYARQHIERAEAIALFVFFLGIDFMVRVLVGLM